MNDEAKHQIAIDRQKKKIKLAIYILLAISAAVSLFVYIKSIPPPPGKYDDLAKCIASSGATFYGAFWCPHCAAQKNAFGDAHQYLPYVECSLPDESGQTQVCIDHGIKSYPTWIFKDGSQLTGEVALDTLAQKTGCTLPDAVASVVTASSTATSTFSTSSIPKASSAFPLN